MLQTIPFFWQIFATWPQEKGMANPTKGFF
jgi:hypothetical protein